MSGLEVFEVYVETLQEHWIECNTCGVSRDDECLRHIWRSHLVCAKADDLSSVSCALLTSMKVSHCVAFAPFLRVRTG